MKNESVPDKPVRFAMRGGPGAHQVDLFIDGERPDWWIDDLTVKATGGDTVQLVVTIGWTEVDIDGDAEVKVDANMAAALKAIGWTPPDGQTSGVA